MGLFDLLRGYVELEASGAFPERLLNLCAQERVRFWRLRWQDQTTFRFRAYLRDRARLEALAERAMCALRELERRGAPVAAGRLAARRGFLAGLAVCLAAVSFFSRFLLVIDVTGNETVPTAVILSQLRRAGVRPGAYGPAIDEKDAANLAIQGLPGLSYLAINIYGVRAEVVVREAQEKPELLDEGTPADVVSEADGVILDIHTESGRAMFADGDIVAKGDVLIAGAMELYEPEGSPVDQGWLMVRAAGTVRAHTWRTLEESVPLTVTVKEYTGEEETRRWAEVFWRRVDFFENSSISGMRYDKITTTRTLTLFGRPMPLSLTTAVLRGYTLREESAALEEECARLEGLLRARLDRLMERNGGRALRCDLTARVEGEKLTVSLLAECEEEIGRVVELPGGTGRIYGEGSAPAAER